MRSSCSLSEYPYYLKRVENTLSDLHRVRCQAKSRRKFIADSSPPSSVAR